MRKILKFNSLIKCKDPIIFFDIYSNSPSKYRGNVCKNMSVPATFS